MVVVDRGMVDEGSGLRARELLLSVVGRILSLDLSGGREGAEGFVGVVLVCADGRSSSSGEQTVYVRGEGRST